MTGWRIATEAVVQDRAKTKVATESQDLQRVPSLNCQRSKAAVQGVLGHQMGSRRDAAEPVFFGNRRPDLRLRDFIAEGAIDHA
jgi:hypothetical protein